MEVLLNIKARLHSQNSLDILRLFVERDQSTILRLLLEAKVTPNDESVQTLVHIAAKRGNSGVIRVLLHNFY